MAETKTLRTVRAVARLTAEEKAALDQLAAERDVTLSYALREGARLYLADARRTIVGDRKRGTGVPTA